MSELERSLSDRGEIKVSNVIQGILPFDKSSNIEIRSIDIFLEGIENKIATVDPVITANGVNFEYVIDGQARAGVYRVVWTVVIDGKIETVVNMFYIGHDEIDRSLPLELQHLA